MNVGFAGVSRSYLYVHTPARYLWAPELDARGDNLAAKLAGLPLRRIDRRAAQGGDERRCQQCVSSLSAWQRAWDLPATIIHPPVEVTWTEAATGVHS